MEWSGQQAAAIKAVANWIKDRRAPQVFRLFGWAGTGKTTLAIHLAAGVSGTVLYACFTGKAALIMRKKGCEGASTIHSLIYKPVEDAVTGITEFVLNMDSPLATASLLIVDEVSMVNEELARDLLSFGVKILVLGDPFQLPPVKGEGFFINSQPDIMLTEIHRQAAENPIIRLSMDVREGRPLVPGWYGDSRVVARGDLTKDELAEAVLGADQVLCGLNKTRQMFNLRIRQLQGLAGDAAPWHPTVGDRLVCLKNNRTKNLLNGGLWDAVKVSTKTGRKFDIEVRSVDEPGLAHVEAEVLVQFFSGTENELDWKILKQSDHFTFGNVLTGHKAQGSQWDNLLVFDESSIFRENALNHRYTTLTRAAERVTMVI